MDVEIEDLSVRFTDAKPHQIDGWRELFELERAQYWDVATIEISTEGDVDPEFETKDVEVIIESGSVSHVIINGEAYPTWDDYADTLDDGEDQVMITEDQFNEALYSDESDDGPMMNYWYPCAVRTDQQDMALAIKNLPLCVVVVDDEEGIALTGGGMDLSWDICEAYVLLGYLPPVHFADLPRMSERWSEGHQTVYEAMTRSLEVEISHNEYRKTRLIDTRAWFAEREAARA